MLKKHSQLFEGVFIAVDLIIVSLAWVFSYYLRFHSGFLEVDKGIPPFVDYAKLLIFVWLIWGFAFKKFGLYKPMRGTSLVREQFRVAKANFYGVLLLLAVTYLFREKTFEFSRLVFIAFFASSTVFLVISRVTLRKVLWAMRRKGMNLRYAVIVGAGELATDIARRITQHPEYGIELKGCLESDPPFRMREVKGTPSYEVRQCRNLLVKCEAISSPFSVIEEKNFEVPVIGSYSELPQLLAKGEIDQVLVALPLEDHDKLQRVLAAIGDEMVDVKIVPDVHRFIQLGSEVQEFDGIPVVSLASTPLVGVNRLIKRCFDLFFSLLFFVMALPVILISALLIKLESRGPAIFVQERVGLDGRPFKIFKLRTMKLDAEVDGAKFATPNDPRTTRLGKLLRKLSIDELPQLLNVIMGNMSLVGPRPERPVFIRDFRCRVPKYMLRHKVQAGMTGLAQINGFRGNTSIEERIRHDLHYIENWSLALDIKILFLTVIYGWWSEAY